MWINNSIAKPLRKGYYKTLVDWDGLGNLEEVNDELFNGVEWDVYESNSQFISYWFAEKEDYNIIADKLKKEMESYSFQILDFGERKLTTEENEALETTFKKSLLKQPTLKSRK